MVAADPADLRRQLQTSLQQLSASAAFPQRHGSCYFDESTSVGDRRVAFLIPGQGVQRVDMLKDLLALHPDGIAIFEEMDQLLQPLLGQPLSSYIYPAPAFEDQQRAAQQAALNDTRIAQPALSVVGLFALDLLRRFGLAPHMTAGHSHGEYVALHAAGCLSSVDLVRLSARRGAAVADACRDQPGAMAAVFADQETTETVLREAGIAAQVANLNAPQNTIVAGPTEAVRQAMEEFARKQIAGRPIRVTAAFHTPAMQGAADQLVPALRETDFAPPKIPVYSNLDAQPHPGDPSAIRDRLASQLVRPVQWLRQIERMYRDGARIFIEVGAGSSLSDFVSRILQDKPHCAIPLERRGREGGLQLAHLLAQCGPWSGS